MGSHGVLVLALVRCRTGARGRGDNQSLRHRCVRDGPRKSHKHDERRADDAHAAYAEGGRRTTSSTGPPISSRVSKASGPSRCSIGFGAGKRRRCEGQQSKGSRSAFREVSRQLGESTAVWDSMAMTAEPQESRSKTSRFPEFFRTEAFGQDDRPSRAVSTRVSVGPRHEI